MKNDLLATCLLAATTAAVAQTTDPATTKQEKTDIGRVSASGASNANPVETPSATGVTRKEIGGGLMVDENVSKSKSSVTRDFIQKQAPTADVFQLIRYSPGANSATSDAWGLSPGVLSVRGMDGTQMGFNFEGMPLNVASNWSVFPGQYIDTENTDVVTLNQGSADLASPNVTATGGIVDLFLHTPSKKAGGLFTSSVGSHNARRNFLRLETGEISDTGFRAFVSVSQIDADHFRGPGHDTKQHVAFGAVQEWGGGSRTKFALTYSKFDRATYRNPTLAQWRQGGIDGAQTNYDKTYTPGSTNYYKMFENPWENLLVSVPTELRVNDKLTVNVTPYLYYGYGGSGSVTRSISEPSVGFGNTVSAVDLNGNGTTTDNNVLIYNPILEKNIRTGMTVKGTYQMDNHTLVAGVWAQHSRDQLYRPYSRMNADGTPVDKNGESALIRNADGEVINGWNQDTHDNFYSFFVGDTISLMEDRLAIDVGVKQLWLERVGINRVPSTVTRTSAEDNPTIPTLAVRYKLDEVNSVFASVSKGFRILPAGALYPRYNASTGAVSTREKPDQPSEESVALELGYRYQGPLVSLTATAFNYEFKNRQISSTVCDGGACISEPINGGKQKAYGLDFEAGLRPYKHFRPYVSFEILRTEIESDIAVSNGVVNDFLPTSGKEAVRAPRFQGALAVDYDDGVFFGNVGLKYVGKQYSTFMNDQEIPSYTTVDIGMGYRFIGATGSRFTKPELRLNLLNVTDRKYLSGVNGVATHSVTTTAVNGTTILAPTSGPNYLIANPFTAMLTFAVGF
ncbi:TonB-dependent receptor [Methyloversatilis thermotolerans]|uniref:TonB-dependent receptor n=1 Tax=Methyloversatilis thermotolerans TaxID=1346290 RepID=UPI00037B6B8D|nr:TonB-dependent receptor [Methyloversatilis thermotolerans]